MEKSVKSSGISQGIVLGVILSLITVIGYAVYQDLFTKWWMVFVQLGVPVTLGIIAAVKAKKLLGGFISFKSAFTSYLIAVAIGTLISMLVSLIIFNFVDPEAAIAIKEKSIEVSVAMMERFGTPKEAIDQAITELEKQDTFGFGTQIKGWFIWMVVYIIVGLLACLAVKKKEPEY